MNRELCKALGLVYRQEFDVPYDNTIPDDAIDHFAPPVLRGKDAFWYGKTHSPESKNKMRKAKVGLKHTEEHKAKIRSFRHSEEAKMNISKNHAFKSGRPGHSERMTGDRNPGIIYKGKSWKIDQTTGKRIWIGEF